MCTPRRRVPILNQVGPDTRHRSVRCSGYRPPMVGNASPRFPPSDVTNSRLAASRRQLQTEADQRLDRTVADGVVIGTCRVRAPGPTGATARGSRPTYPLFFPMNHRQIVQKAVRRRWWNMMPRITPSSVAGGIWGAESSGPVQRRTPRPTRVPTHAQRHRPCRRSACVAGRGDP